MVRILQNRWWVVFASACGLMVGAGVINVFAMGVFLKPITEDLGVGRGLFGTALWLNSTANAVACFFVGWLIQRWGLRRVMIPGILLCALATACYGLIQASPFVLTYAIFAVGGFIAGCQTPIPYATATSLWFDRRRGIALGLAIAGVGLGAAVLPKIAGLLIGAFGWRLAFVGLGLAMLAIALLPVALFIREPPDPVERGQRHATLASAATMPGLAAGIVLRRGLFWALTAAFFLDVVAIQGTLTQMVALLTDRGMALGDAINTLSSVGIALILGRILSGWCLDRFWGPYVAVIFFIVPMIGIASLASGAGGAAPLIGAIGCGIGIGAEVDLMAFFASRYFGLRDYAKIYGIMFGVFSFGVGVGPALSGASWDLFHSYTPIFVVYEIMLAVTCIVFLRLGPYPFPAPQRVPAGGERKVVA
jgi:MFS family permease